MPNTASLPVVNLQRDDFCVTLAASVAFLALAVICTLWHPDVDPQMESNERWIDIVILFSTCTSIILLLIAVFKLLCGRGDLCTRGDDYEEIDDVSPQLGFLSPRLRMVPNVDSPKYDGDSHAMFPEPAVFSPSLPRRGDEEMTNGRIAHYQQPAPAAATLQHSNETRNVSHTAVRPRTEGHRNVTIAAAGTGGDGKAMRPVEVTPLKDGDIDSGIELERSNHEFLHHGIRFDAGTWRVLNVRKGSCCERQGTCGPGDVICSLNGVKIAETGNNAEVAALLRGKPGNSIAMEVIHVDCRHPMTRQVILAPSAADLGISSRGSQRR